MTAGGKGLPSVTFSLNLPFGFLLDFEMELNLVNYGATDEGN